MGNVKKGRAAVRAKVRGKRAAVRKALGKGVASASEGIAKAFGCRAGSAASGAVCLVLALLLAFGCNTATPTSKSATTKACDNVTTVNNHFGLIVIPTNGGPPLVVGLTGPVTVNVSDVNGTVAQSADTEGGDRTDLAAVPTMSAGITGDKPIEAVQKAVMAFASPQEALSVTAESLVKKFGLGATTNALVEAAGGCADGSCGDAAK